MLQIMSGIFCRARLNGASGFYGCRPLLGDFRHSSQRMIATEKTTPPEQDRNSVSGVAGSDLDEQGRKTPVSERKAEDVSAPRTAESALLVAARRRQAISEAGGYTHVIVKEERFTDLAAPRKRRQRISRPWVGAFKPVTLRRNTIMPARETTIAPKPKIVLSPQWPLVYKQKMYLDAEVAFTDADEFDPENPPPEMLKSQFFPRYMRFFTVSIHFMALVSVIYLLFICDYGRKTSADWVRNYFHKKMLDFFVLEPSEMSVLAKREAELRALNPPKVDVVSQVQRELQIERLRYQDSLSVQYTQTDKPPKMIDA